MRRKPPKVLGAWALHILCDIPTHELRFFPTPLVNGIHWSQPWFMALDYGCLALGYALWLRRVRAD